MSNQLNLPQVDSSEVVETSQGWKQDAPELNFKSPNKGSEYLVEVGSLHTLRLESLTRFSSTPQISC